MKTIDTLVEDIYGLFNSNREFDPKNVEVFGQKLAAHISNRISEEKGRPTLRLSNLGKPCDRELWYSINDPSGSESLPPNVRFKFLYGDILEELVLFLAREAGHQVEGQQDTIEINGVKGHRDAVIDGRVVDVKSASTFSFCKFKEHRLPDDDAFGYIDQLGGYVSGSRSDPLVVDKDVGSFIAVDKTLGNICVDTYSFEGVDYYKKVDDKKAMLAGPLPDRPYQDEPEGKSGNRKLGTKCSYCAFKHKCWPGLRTFLYSNKPVFLTHVEREPKVMEVGTNGEVISKF